jgi:pimeloyl-ACP methyl ester carboxylesterase
MPRINAGGVELYYESAGEGVPLVLQAHHHTDWMLYQFPYFAQFYHVIIFDRRGVGRSASPPGEWTTADFARDLRNLLDALDIDQAIIGGVSLGGTIACQFALDYPERARALIVGHTIPYLWPLGLHWLDDALAAIARDEVPGARQPRSYEWESEGPPIGNPAWRTTPAAAFLATLQLGLGNTRETATKALRTMGAWDLRPRYPELNRLNIPTLLIVGGHEPQKTIELSYELHQQIPGSEYIILPGAYHAAAREEPVNWIAAVHGFLQRNGM